MSIFSDDGSFQEYLGTGELVEAEIERLEGYEQVYRRTHPVPEKRILSYAKEMGLEAVSYVISSIGAIGLSAVRTAAIFMLSEILLFQALGETNNAIWGAVSTSIPVLAMILALLSFEAYLFAHGLTKGKMSDRIESSGWGLFMAFSVTVLAGVISSLPLLQIENFETNAWVRPVLLGLVVASGVGAPVLAYFGAYNLGVLGNRWEAKLKEVDEEHGQAMGTWYSGMQAEYRRRGRLDLYGEEFASKTAAKSDKKTSRNEKETEEVTQMVRDWLNQKGLTAFDIGPKNKYPVSPLDIANELGLPDSNDVRVVLSRERSSGND